jgi:hypothetical protein
LNVALQLGSLDSLSGFPRSVLFPNLSTFKSSNLPTVLQPSFGTIFVHSKPFRINSCKSVSKQMTSTPFRINTYEKTRGWGRGAIACRKRLICSNLSRFLSNSCALFCTTGLAYPLFLQSFAHSLHRDGGCGAYTRNLAHASGISRTKRKQTRTGQTCWSLGAAASPNAVTSRPRPGQFSLSGPSSLRLCPDVVQPIRPCQPN